jgi:hypothetical protein
VVDGDGERRRPAMALAPVGSEKHQRERVGAAGDGEREWCAETELVDLRVEFFGGDGL